jgi:hypothetical protein
MMHRQPLRSPAGGWYAVRDGRIVRAPAPSDAFVQLVPRLRGGFPIVGSVLTTNPAELAAQAVQDATDKAQKLQYQIFAEGGTIRNMIQAYQKWSSDFAAKRAQFIAMMARWAFMFGTFMKTMFQFFVIIILVRMLIGFFSKPLEFIMLGISCIVLAVAYVLYYIFSVPPFIIVPYLIYFILFDLIPLLFYTMVFGALFVVITLFCLLLSIINVMTGGLLNNLVLCQNSPSNWFRMPNHHLGNKFERGLFCSRSCFRGYYPGPTGRACNKVWRGTPSYCPQAMVMRLYQGKGKRDLNWSFPDYRILGNWKYLSRSPREREVLIKEHLLRRQGFLEGCEQSMKKYGFLPLQVCSSLDVMDSKKSQIPGWYNTRGKLERLCQQAYCNSTTNYPFCVNMGSSQTDGENFWVRVAKAIVMVTVVVLIVTLTVKHMRESFERPAMPMMPSDA